MRRVSAVMRFLAHMRESATEADLIQALIQAAAVWYDLDARAYRRELHGRFVLDTWLPGADVANDPHDLDVLALLPADGPTHISSIADLEQLGWRTQQGEILLLPVVTGGQVRWLLVVAGTLERDIEATLALVCRSAGGALDQLGARRQQEVQQSLLTRMQGSRGHFQSVVSAVVHEYVTRVGAASVRVAVRPAGHAPLTLHSTGDGWATEPVPTLAPGDADVGTGRIALAFAVGHDTTASIELLAFPERPFSLERADVARIGGQVLSVWLAGISLGAARAATERAVQPPAAPPFEQAMQEELARARRLSLSGGVLVASVPGASGMPDPRVLSIVIRTVRAELRSSDLLGQLASGDIAAVLVRTSADGVATAALRVRQRLEALARERRLPPVVVGHALYPAGIGESAGGLVQRARREAGLMFS